MIEKIVVFLVKFCKKEPLTHLRWLFLETCTHSRPENMFLLSASEDFFSNSTVKLLGSTPRFLIFKTNGTFARILQKRLSRITVVARFRDTSAPASKKTVSTDSKAKSFQ